MIPRAPLPDLDIGLILTQIESSYGWDQIKHLKPSFADADTDTIIQLLSQASRFASEYLDPLNAEMDADGPKLISGRVKTTKSHADAWRTFAEGQWVSVSAPVELGGFGLPSGIWAMMQSIFDRACPAFGMMAVPQLAASKLIAAYAPEDLRKTWLPQLLSSQCGATMCISEVGAGSDVKRMTTRAEPQPDGSWHISGEKNWISFADQDLTEQIAHCVLAKTEQNGKAGISLFLAPSHLHAKGEKSRNEIHVRRLEEKMGLHGSPTCAVGFENAKAWLMGEPGRGLSQMFVMITGMRLAVGAMGLGIAQAASDTAHLYSRERLQGGNGPAPVPIIEHPDVHRMLLDMKARTEMLRGLTLALANISDIRDNSPEPENRQTLTAATAWLLPLIKTLGAETATNIPNMAVQVLGGAGYTRDWPVEQAMRDGRVLSIFEGTTGIQGIDLVMRQLRRTENTAFDGFMSLMRHTVSGLDAARRSHIQSLINDFSTLSEKLIQASDADALAAATHYHKLAGEMALVWIAAHLIQHDTSTPEGLELKKLATYFLDTCNGQITGLYQHTRNDLKYVNSYSSQQ